MQSFIFLKCYSYPERVAIEQHKFSLSWRIFSSLCLLNSSEIMYYIYVMPHAYGGYIILILSMQQFVIVLDLLGCAYESLLYSTSQLLTTAQFRGENACSPTNACFLCTRIIHKRPFLLLCY